MSSTHELCQSLKLFDRFSSSKQTKLYRINTLNNNPFESPKLGGVGVQGQGKGSS